MIECNQKGGYTLCVTITTTLSFSSLFSCCLAALAPVDAATTADATMIVDATMIAAANN